MDRWIGGGAGWGCTMMMCVSLGGGREGGCVCLYHKQRMGEPIQTEIEAGVDVDCGYGGFCLLLPAAAVLRIVGGLSILFATLPCSSVVSRPITSLTLFGFIHSGFHALPPFLPLVVASVGRSGGTDRGAWVVWIDWIYWITGQELSRVVSGE